MDDPEGAPKSTADALRLLSDAGSYRQMAEECGEAAPGAAAACRSKAEQIEALATDYLGLAEKPAVGAGGEAQIPREERPDLWGLKETLDNPGRETVEASRARLNLLVDVEAVHLGIDAAATIDAGNSLEKMLAHQMAAAHRMSMKFVERAQRELWRQDPEAVIEANRCANAAARMMRAYREGLHALGKMRNGGRQVVTVQHVQVSEGSQAVVAGHVNGTGGRGGGRRDF